MTREEAIRELREDKALYETDNCHAGDGSPDGDLLEAIDMAIEALQADRPRGKWIMHGEPPWYVRECSECGTKWHQWSGDSNPNYCGNCGAKMDGERSEE